MIRSYVCTVKGTDWQRTIHAKTAGKAKYRYWCDIQDPWPGIPFTAIRVLTVGPPQTSDEFRRCAEYRGVPFARIGMQVRVGGDLGVISGHNSSANFNVIFTEGKFKGQELNCHPGWMM